MFVYGLKAADVYTFSFGKIYMGVFICVRWTKVDAWKLEKRNR